MTEYRAPKELAEFILEQAAKEGYCIVHLTTKGGTSSHVEVILDKEGGISLNECGAFNKKIMEWIDGNNMFIRGYVVDVCSPGLDRELRSDTEFEWAVGKKVTVIMHAPEGGNKEIVGKLASGTPEEVVIEDENGNIVTVKRKNVIKARLCVVL